jgi:hypothetical protein
MIFPVDNEFCASTGLELCCILAARIRPLHPEQQWIQRDGVGQMHSGYPQRLVPQQMSPRAPMPPQSFVPGPSAAMIPNYPPPGTLAMPAEAGNAPFLNPAPPKPPDPPPGR